MPRKIQGFGRFASLLWVLLLFAGAVAPVSAARQQGLLWKIEGHGHPPSFLYGTIHIGDPRVLQLAPPVRQAFDHAHVFVMEVIMDYAAYGRLMNGMFLTGDRTLRDIVGDDLFRRLVTVMKPRGFGEETLLRMKPWAVMSIAGIPAVGSGVALDLELYTDAMQQDKQVFGLETADEQLNVFDGMSEAAQVAMVRSTVEESESDKAVLQDMIQAYLHRDLDALAKAAEQDAAERYPAFAREFNRRAIDDRNRRMVERMQPRLEKGDAFIAVGALHLPGKRGIIHLLRERGYRVTSVW